MLAWLVGLMMASTSPAILTISTAYAEEIDVRDVWITKLIDCESQGSTTVKVLDTNGYFSYGLGQFQMSTWLKYGKPFGATKQNIYNGELQRKVMRDMLDNGGQDHWYHCSQRIGNYPIRGASP